MISSAVPAILFWVALGLVVYHHLLFPLLARHGARALRALRPAAPVIPQCPPEATLPRIAIIVPAYNEEAWIAGKIDNLAALDYPADKLCIILALDGPSDKTRDVAKLALAKRPWLTVQLRDYRARCGKVAVINKVMRDVDSDIVVFSDVSSMVAPDTLKRFAGHFSDQETGVVCAAYRLEAPAGAGERAYWDFQIALKRDENTIGAVMGAHGAFYAIRTHLFEPLAADTINDDFIIPTRIVARGYRSVYDTAIVVRERAPSNAAEDFQRRVRLSQGAMQQLVRSLALFNLRKPGIAFVFASGKALRALMPLLGVVMMVTSIILVIKGEGGFSIPVIGGLILIALGLLHVQENLAGIPKFLHPLAYLAAGHMAGLIGTMRFFLPKGRYKKDHMPEDEGLQMGFISPPTRLAKRVFDLAAAGLGLICLLIVLPIIALAIKADSNGPVFYRQLRVGTCSKTRSHLFMLIKFRTMYLDAEKATGAVWAQKQDGRITSVGRFLRRTRLDELPQCLNVLKGDMSVVGPRPERPAFFAQLEREIPFYSERTYGLRPGITGLAQVTLGYDECVEDVRQKVLHDHVYATRLARLAEWVWTDFSICFRTCLLVARGKGQ